VKITKSRAASRIQHLDQLIAACELAAAEYRKRLNECHELIAEYAEQKLLWKHFESTQQHTDDADTGNTTECDPRTDA